MTVSILSSRSNTYNGNGATAVFAYPFRIDANNHLGVYKRETATGNETKMVLTTDYTVSGVGDDNGGNITLVDPATRLPTGYTMVIIREAPRSQLTTVTNQGPLFGNTIERNGFDVLLMLIQELQEQLDRCPKIDVTDPDPVPDVRDELVNP